MLLSPQGLSLFYREILLKFDRILAMNTQAEIISFLQHNRKFLSDHYHVSKIALFGSFARNEQRDDSDVDLLIELENGTENVHETKQSLREFLSSSFERSIDLAREKYLKSYAKDQILKDAVYV